MSLIRLHISSLEKAVTDGNVFFFAERPTLANDAIRDYLITVSSKDVLLLVDIDAFGDIHTEMFELTTDTGGTSIPLNNAKRSSANVATTTITHTPTPVGDGNSLGQGGISGGTKNGAQSSGTAGGLLLKASTKYLYRIQNKAGSGQDLPVSMVVIEGDL